MESKPTFCENNFEFKISLTNPRSQITRIDALTGNGFRPDQRRDEVCQRRLITNQPYSD